MPPQEVKSWLMRSLHEHDNMYEKPAPSGYHTLTPALTVRDGKAAVDFYQRAFGATVRHVMEMPDGKVMHAELQVGDSVLMLSDEFPDWGAFAPQSIGGTASSLNVYVDDVDTVFGQAVAAGATVIHPLTNQFWGDRMGNLLDPFGHKWSVATRVEEVSPEETARRGEEWTKSME